MGLADFDVPKEADRFYWIKLNNKLFNSGYNYCMNNCKTESPEVELGDCYNHCYTNFMVAKKQVMHQAQDKDEETFAHCISNSRNPEDLDSILKCSQNTHVGKMLLISDSIKSK